MFKLNVVRPHQVSYYYQIKNDKKVFRWFLNNPLLFSFNDLQFDDRVKEDNFKQR